MNAVRVRTRLNGPLSDLPELRQMVGKVVEIIVWEEAVEQAASNTATVSPPTGTVTARILQGGRRRPASLDLDPSEAELIDWDADLDPPIRRHGHSIPVCVVRGGRRDPRLDDLGDEAI
jgi:hypothetical protein